MAQATKQPTQTIITSRLGDLYKNTFAAELKTELGLSNINQVPKLEKIVLNIGLGRQRR